MGFYNYEVLPRNVAVAGVFVNWEPFDWKRRSNKVAEKTKAVGVFDRAVSYGVAGPAFIEFRNAAYGLTIPVMDFIGGLGGRDVSGKDIRFIYERLLEAAKTGKARKEITWMNTRGVEQ